MLHIREEQISAYVDRQLDVDETGAIEIHLRQCESCRAVLTDLRGLTDLYREAQRHHPSPFLWNRIADGFNERRPARGRLSFVIENLWNLGRRPGYASAALIVFMASGIALFWGHYNNHADQAALAEIDRAYRSLAAEDPDAYNPFSSGKSFAWDANPFRSTRLSGRIDSAAPAVPQR